LDYLKASDLHTSMLLIYTQVVNTLAEATGSGYMVAKHTQIMQAGFKFHCKCGKSFFCASH